MQCSKKGDYRKATKGGSAMMERLTGPEDNVTGGE